MSKALRHLAALTLVGGVLVAPGMAPMAAAGDRPTEFQFSSAAYQAQEPTGSTTTATITLTRLNLKGQASVVVTSTDGTGTAGSDYTAVDSTVKFGTKVAVKTFTVTLLPDAANEPNETFTLSVQPAPGSTSAVQIGTPSTAAFTIVSDRDSDGLSDQDEVGTYGTDPDDPDTDRDGLTDGDEVNIHNTDPTFADIDNDGLNDSAEIDCGSDPQDPDADNDSLNDFTECLVLITDPNVADTDGDGLGDGYEDGSSFTDPRDPDSDDDGFSDGVEWGAATDPNDPSSYPQ